MENALIPVFMFIVKQLRRQALCKHERGVTETQSCSAICKQCGKNLGFIGKWRKTQKEHK
jgi:hypothetical protein